MPGSIANCARQMLLALAFLAGGLAAAVAQDAGQGAEMAPATLQTGQSAVRDGAYRLGASEQIGLRVVVWDSTTLTFANLEAISGDYKIGNDGKVMLPIVGAMEAAGATTVELAERIATELQRRTGLAETPSVAIEIAEYRPLFVLGDVARPGEYPYRPGIRAMQALALAGGYYRLTDEQGSRVIREGLRVAGNLRENRVDLTAGRIREARLLAEADGRSDFDLPGGLTHPEGASAIDQIYAREKSLMQTRREALARAVESLESSRELLETEAGNLESKSEGLDKQIALMSEAVGNIEALADRGLTLSSNLLNMQRALFDLEARQLDTQNQVFRARQSMGEIERDLNNVTQQRATEILNELQDLQAQIARFQVRDDTQQRILVETQAEAAMLAEAEDGSVELVPVFRVSREVEGDFRTAVVDPQTPLEPLDVLEVMWTDPADVPSQ
jgi:protein involved in polysaccharide export with SLBB domain